MHHVIDVAMPSVCRSVVSHVCLSVCHISLLWEQIYLSLKILPSSDFSFVLVLSHLIDVKKLGWHITPITGVLNAESV